jgi:hypothetical protein
MVNLWNCARRLSATKKCYSGLTYLEVVVHADLRETGANGPLGRPLHSCGDQEAYTMSAEAEVQHRMSADLRWSHRGWRLCRGQHISSPRGVAWKRKTLGPRKLGSKVLGLTRQR